MRPDIPAARISMAGASALLLDGARSEFDADVQRRVWTVGRAIRRTSGVQEAVPGMNNLMVLFDPLKVAPAAVETALMALWETSSLIELKGREVEIPVTYGGAAGEDLEEHAQHCGLDVDELVQRHSAAVYSVAAIGAMPGFPYLSGLDPRLARARRASPRTHVAQGAVIIGGTQAGIMPRAGPSGWHVIGRTDLTLFDAQRVPPATLQPGDSVRFKISRVEF